MVVKTQRILEGLANAAPQAVSVFVRQNSFLGVELCATLQHRRCEMAGPLYARYIPEKVATKATTAAPPAEAPRAQQPAPSAPPAKKEKRERERPKKRKRDKNDESEEEEAPKKHKLVLSKFENSKRVADAVREEPEQAAESIEEEQPELHGTVSASLCSIRLFI